MSVPVLTTPRLILRGFSVDDLDAYAALHADPSVVARISRVPRSRQECWMRLLRSIGHWHALGFGFWAIEDRGSGGLVGEAGLMRFERGLDPPPPPELPEAGWLLLTAAQGRGLATEAVRAALDWAKHVRGMEHAFCMIDPDNAPSLRVAAKCGFADPAPARYGEETVRILRR